MAEGSGEAGESLEDRIKGEAEDSSDGAVVIIRNDKGEETEFYLEQTPEGYFIEKYVGTLKLVGGMIKKGETALQGLNRELHEELTDKKAADIIYKHAKFYKCVSGDMPGIVYIFESVLSHAEWEIVRASQLTHDAGPKRLVKLQEIKNQDYAFNHGDVLKDYILENKIGQDYVRLPNMQVPSLTMLEPSLKAA